MPLFVPTGSSRCAPSTRPSTEALPFLPRLKLWAHGKQTAYTPKADAYQAGGVCVVACPEKAITLVQRK